MAAGSIPAASMRGNPPLDSIALAAEMYQCLPKALVQSTRHLE
jgi:hypothetical protein